MNRTHILKVYAKNVKVIKEVEINDIGDIVEIRGDTGQGKTAILDAIKGGLCGLDPSMVRQGETTAEIILTLDDAKIRRIINADGGKDKITVTDPKTGKSLGTAKEFLSALCGKTIFNPLEFVRLGQGDAKGKTERLRRQREILLDAMPVSLCREDAVAAIRKVAPDEQCLFSGIDFDVHGLVVCQSIQKQYYDSRKQQNAITSNLESELSLIPIPARVPDEPLHECKRLAGEASSRFYKAQAEESVREQSRARAGELRVIISEMESSIPQNIDGKLSEIAKESYEINASIENLRRQISELESRREILDQKTRDLHKAKAQNDRLDAFRAELLSLESSTSNPTHDLDELKSLSDAAANAVTSREIADRRDVLSKKLNESLEAARRLDAIVKLFRDDLPKSIVESMEMPVPGIGIDGDTVTYNGIPLHQLGTSEQIKIAVLLAAALNPRTGFILIDGAESMGSKDRLALAEASKELDLQLIMTYVDPTAEPSNNTIVMRNGEKQ